jgi:hypothetical protein
MSHHTKKKKKNNKISVKIILTGSVLKPCPENCVMLCFYIPLITTHLDNVYICT